MEMINQNGINIDDKQNVWKENFQIQDQKINYLNRNQNNINELKNTLKDKPLIPPEWEKEKDGIQRRI